MSTSKKLIEVALPLEAINEAAAREKSIRHGHPSTLHLWWARRPLAAARAVIFAQMVDDPSEYAQELTSPGTDTRRVAEREWKKRLEVWESLPDEAKAEKPKPTLEEIAIEIERNRLFGIIEDLVQWENTTNESVLRTARDEIWRSWRRTCAENADHPQANELFDREKLPGFHDPFAGGGALPLEAQRLGLEAYASDLNPVAVLINKAMIEIPPKFADQPPVNPDAQAKTSLSTWTGAQGLAEDVRHYGQWMRDEAEKRIGHLYPKVKITREMVAERPDLEPYEGKELTVIAWIWARTVKSPNPAFRDVDVPLASTFMLSTKPGKEAYVEPVIENGGYRFVVKVGKPADPERAKRGTKLARGANFECVMSGSPLSEQHIVSEAMAGRVGERLMAVVAEGDSRRVYLTPDSMHEKVARVPWPSGRPELAMPDNPRWFSPPRYGMHNYTDLFTPRQLTALTTFSDLVAEARERVKADYLGARASRAHPSEDPTERKGGLRPHTPVHSRGDLPRWEADERAVNEALTTEEAEEVEEMRPGRPRSQDEIPLCEGGTGAQAYADAVATYLAFGVSRASDAWSSVVTWRNQSEASRSSFARQALPMTWDFTEVNPYSESCGNWLGNSIEWVQKGIIPLPLDATSGHASIEDAAAQRNSSGKFVSTDPPYYDNIGYADLSDFFYVWLRRSLRDVYPDLFATIAVPKAEELVATPYRHGSKQAAERFFLDGMTEAMRRICEQAHPAFPVTIYYAFKQQETRTEKRGAREDDQTANARSTVLSSQSSTGWETFLEALFRSGFALTGTWPMRTEKQGRVISNDTNALASSIVLVCRRRDVGAPTATRREFLNALQKELPQAIADLQRGNVAPVDLQQAAIGPGMAIFTRYAKVLDADGKPLTVRDALALINQALDEALAHQEGDFDGDTRWALAWFEQFGFAEGEFGVAEVLSKAKATSVQGVVDAGIAVSGKGKVRLLKPEELPEEWTPEGDKRLTVWDIVHHLIRMLDKGEAEAAALLARLGARAEVARELAYRLFSICDRRRWAAEALRYNALVQSWPEIARLAQHMPKEPIQLQGTLNYDA